MPNTTLTGNGFEYFRWLSIRGRVKLQAEGYWKNPAWVLAHIRAELGASKRATCAQLLPLIEAKLLEVKASLQPGDITND